MASDLENGGSRDKKTPKRKPKRFARHSKAESPKHDPYAKALESYAAFPYAKETLALMRRETKLNAQVPAHLLPYVIGVETPKFHETPHTEDEIAENERLVKIQLELALHSERILQIREHIWEQHVKQHGDEEKKILQHLPLDLAKYVTDPEEAARLDQAPSDVRENILAALRSHGYIYGLPVLIAVQNDRWHQPKDLPLMPREVRASYLEHPGRVDIGLFHFATALTNNDFKNAEVARFAQSFGAQLKKVIHSEDTRAETRNRTINAYWALISFGVLKEKYDQETFDGHEIDTELLQEHLETFLVLERERRLRTMIEKEADEATRATLRRQYTELQESNAYAALAQRKLPISHMETLRNIAAQKEVGSDEKRKATEKLTEYRRSDEYTKVARVFTAQGIFNARDDDLRTIVDLTFARLTYGKTSLLNVFEDELPEFEHPDIPTGVYQSQMTEAKAEALRRLEASVVNRTNDAESAKASLFILDKALKEMSIEGTAVDAATLAGVLILIRDLEGAREKARRARENIINRWVPSNERFPATIQQLESMRVRLGEAEKRYENLIAESFSLLFELVYDDGATPTTERWAPLVEARLSNLVDAELRTVIEILKAPAEVSRVNVALSNSAEKLADTAYRLELLRDATAIAYGKIRHASEKGGGNITSKMSHIAEDAATYAAAMATMHETIKNDSTLTPQILSTLQAWVEKNKL